MGRGQIGKRISGIIRLLPAAVLWAAFSVLSAGAETDARVVRIPCNYNDFLMVDDEGSPSGFYAEYLEKLAEVNNWEYEYVKTSWPEAVEMLESGEIDFLYPVNYSEERDETMDFSTLSLGYTASGIFAPMNRGYYYEDYASFDGARIACVRDSSNAWGMEEFAREQDFSFEPVYLATTDEVMEAPFNGKADLIISNAVNSISGCALVAMLDAKPVYLAVRGGNTELLKMIDSGMQRLLKNDSELVQETIQNTLAGKNGTLLLAFTEQEQALIQSGEEVKVGFYQESEPLAYIKEDGSYGGVYIELLSHLKENSGLNLVPYPISQDRNWKELLGSGEIDFYIGASDVIVSQDEDICTTDSFMEYANTLVTRADCAFSQLEVPVIALTYGRANWGDYLTRHLGRELKIQYYRTAKDCMIAVIQGEVDASLLNNLEFNYQSKNSRLSSLIQWTMYRFPTDVSLAAADHVDAALLSVVNKVLKQLSPAFVDTVADECLNMPYTSYTMEDSLYSARIPLMMMGLGVLAICVIAAIIILFRRNQAAIQKKAAEREQYQLRVLAAMSRDYAAIYFSDLDRDSCECMQHLEDDPSVKTGQTAFSGAMKEYLDEWVQAEYVEQLRPLCDPQEIIRRFKENPFISVRYQVRPGENQKEAYEMHFVDVSTNEQEHKMTFGIRCVDNIVREEQKQRQILKDALDSANMANNSKSEFLSRMSHDIRTPMNAIIGMTVIAEAHAEEPARVREALKKISSASRYLLSLINDVLDMSKIEAGKLGLNEETINLSGLVSDFLTVIQPRVREHRHDLKVYIQNVRHEEVIGDSLRIQQVFVNIMDNAIKYTPDGGELSLTVRELPVATPSVGCYEFVFADNGIGMSEGFQEHIFEPFKREEDLRISKIQGTGLGLSITQNIVRMMNGNIKVESKPGKGSAFTVTLFLKLQEKEEIDMSQFADISVLVADDDRDACESLCAMLGQIGMKGMGCTSGQEAVEAVRSSLNGTSPFYAAILDWKMPGMDGVETARAIKRLTDDDLPVIILSAYDWSEIEEEARNAGVDSFLSKPVFQSGIIRLFQTLKDRKSENEKESTSLETIQDAHFDGRRVLLVEDNPLNREIAKEILEMAGLTVEEAEDGQAALELFQASERGFYDMVLMDIQMPVMNGYDASRAIRAQDRPDAGSIPIIAMTANAFVEDVQQSRAAGMNEHLEKPIDFEKLCRILEKYLDGGRRR